VIRVLLVDEHRIFRQALAFMLEREPDISAVGQAETWADARTTLADADVAILDGGFPSVATQETIEQLRVVNPRARVIILAWTGGSSGDTCADVVLPTSARLGDIIRLVRRLGAPLQLAQQ